MANQLNPFMSVISAWLLCVGLLLSGCGGSGSSSDPEPSPTPTPVPDPQPDPQPEPLPQSGELVVHLRDQTVCGPVNAASETVRVLDENYEVLQTSETDAQGVARFDGVPEHFHLQYSHWTDRDNAELLSTWMNLTAGQYEFAVDVPVRPPACRPETISITLTGVPVPIIESRQILISGAEWLTDFGVSLAGVTLFDVGLFQQTEPYRILITILDRPDTTYPGATVVSYAYLELPASGRQSSYTVDASNTPNPVPWSIVSPGSRNGAYQLEAWYTGADEVTRTSADHGLYLGDLSGSAPYIPELSDHTWHLALSGSNDPGASTGYLEWSLQQAFASDPGVAAFEVPPGTIENTSWDQGTASLDWSHSFTGIPDRVAITLIDSKGFGPTTSVLQQRIYFSGDHSLTGLPPLTENAQRVRELIGTPDSTLAITELRFSDQPHQWTEIAGDSHVANLFWRTGNTEVYRHKN